MTILQSLARISSILCGIIYFSSPLSAAVSYGSNGPILSTSTQGADYLLGQEISVTQVSLITHFGVNFQGTNGFAEYSIYDDTGSGGLPGDLIVSTGSVNTDSLTLDVDGYTEIALTAATNLQVGNYWLMGLSANKLFIGETSPPTTTITAYIAHNYGVALPSPSGITATYSDSTFGYYITGSAVPEPSILLCTVFTGFGVFFRRSR